MIGGGISAHRVRNSLSCFIGCILCILMLDLKPAKAASYTADEWTMNADKWRIRWIGIQINEVRFDPDEGDKLLYLPTMANPPYKHIEFSERRIKHHKKYRKYQVSIILKSYFGVAFLVSCCSPLCMVEEGQKCFNCCTKFVLIRLEQRVPAVAFKSFTTCFRQAS